MSRLTLIRLLFVLVVLAGIIGVLNLDRTSGRAADTLLFPDLKAALNDVSRIVVTGAGGSTLATLERSAERWTVAERGNYPADVGRIRRNLLALADARIAEEKTANPDLYPRLGVEDVAGEGATGVQLELTTGKDPVRLIIGLTQPGTADRTYVREPGQATSWLVKAEFDLGKTADAWIDRQLVSLPVERISTVTVTHPGQPPLVLRKPAPDAADFDVENVPPGRSLSYPGVGTALAAVLADLRLEAVDPREVLGTNPGKPVVARFTTTDGLTIETSAFRLPAGTRFTIVASGEGDPARQEADAINARLGGWVYTLRDYPTEQLTHRLQDLLAPA